MVKKPPPKWTLERETQLWRLYEIEDRKYTEIEQIMGISIGMIAGRLRKLRKRNFGTVFAAMAQEATGIPDHPVMHLTNTTCRWPIGDPTDPAFRFCMKASKLGEPYCKEHMQQGFHRPRK